MNKTEKAIAELLAAPPGRRHLLARNGSRCQEPVCRALIAAGFALRFSDPQGALQRVELAAQVADGLLVAAPSAGRYDLAAEARGYLGNARKALGDLRAARIELRRAAELQRRGTGSDDLRGTLLEFRASVAEGERRFAEAGKHLRAAAAIWCARGDTERLARVSILAGIVRSYAGETAGALADFRAALRLTGDLHLIRCAILSIGWTLVDGGQPEAALNVLVPYRAMLVEGGEQPRLKLEWTEGRIASELGCDAAGLGHLETAREGFAVSGKGQAWALVTLDLAVHHGRAGRLGLVRQLAEEAAPVIASLGVASHALVAAHLAKIATAGETLPAAMKLSGLMMPLRGAAV